MGQDGHFASLFPSMVDDAAMDVDTAPAIIQTGPEGSPVSTYFNEFADDFAIAFGVVVGQGHRQERGAESRTNRSVIALALFNYANCEISSSRNRIIGLEGVRRRQHDTVT